MEQPESPLLWLFDNLREEPFAAIPISNLTAKGGPTVIKRYEQIGSYNWILERAKAQNGSADGEPPKIPKPTIIIPGAPRELTFWNGGRLKPDEGYLLYDVNHLKVPDAPMDPLFLSLIHQNEKEGKEPINFQEFDFITDAINMQKIFAFCKGAATDDESGAAGVFRVDFERVGQTILACRAEACDVIPYDFLSFDRSFRSQSTSAATTFTGQNYQQLATYQFGQLKFLVRFEADCADYTKLAGNAGSPLSGLLEPGSDVTEARKPFEVNPDLQYAEFGKRQRHILLTTTTYPQGKGFPFYTYAQLFFTGLDALLVGWWRGGEDFGKPAQYSCADVNKMVKPPPYVQLSKTHDCLVKVMNMLKKNREGLRISLVWKGSDYIEIYEKNPFVPSAISDNMRAYLKSQVAEELLDDMPPAGEEEENGEVEESANKVEEENKEEDKQREKEENMKRKREEREKKKKEEAENTKREEAEKTKREEAEKTKREEAEKTKREEERKKKEEEQRKNEEGETRKKEEEKRKREEEERKKKEEDERRKRDMEEKRTKREEENRKRTEEKRRKEEKEKRKRDEEEKRKRDEEEKRRKDEEDKRKREEDEKRKREEEERKQEAARRKAEEEREKAKETAADQKKPAVEDERRRKSKAKPATTKANVEVSPIKTLGAIGRRPSKDKAVAAATATSVVSTVTSAPAPAPAPAPAVASAAAPSPRVAFATKTPVPAASVTPPPVINTETLASAPAAAVSPNQPGRPAAVVEQKPATQEGTALKITMKARRPSMENAAPEEPIQQKITIRKPSLTGAGPPWRRNMGTIAPPEPSTIAPAPTAVPKVGAQAQAQQSQQPFQSKPQPQQPSPLQQKVHPQPQPQQPSPPQPQPQQPSPPQPQQPALRQQPPWMRQPQPQQQQPVQPTQPQVQQGKMPPFYQQQAMQPPQRQQPPWMRQQSPQQPAQIQQMAQAPPQPQFQAPKLPQQPPLRQFAPQQQPQASPPQNMAGGVSQVPQKTPTAAPPLQANQGPKGSPMFPAPSPQAPQGPKAAPQMKGPEKPAAPASVAQPAPPAAAAVAPAGDGADPEGKWKPSWRSKKK